MPLDEHHNRVGGATVVYEDLDDAAANGSWDDPTEAANPSRAVNDPDVIVYLGTYNSGAARASIPILCQATLAMISPSNTYLGLTKHIPQNAPNEPDVYYPDCKRNYARRAVGQLNLTPTKSVMLTACLRR